MRPLLPGEHAWTRAVETLLDAHRTREFLKRNFTRMTDHEREVIGNEAEQSLIVDAAPFSWSRETMEAVLAASRSVPVETKLDRWNLPVLNAWWHFEEPLPYQPSMPASPSMIRVLNFGWVKGPSGTFFGVSTWLDEPQPYRFSILPSQVFWWNAEESIAEMLTRVRREHWDLFGPLGPYRNESHTPLESFMAITEGLAKFIVAALAWLETKVLVEEPGHIERHRRKALAKETGVTARDVRIVQLRRTERSSPRESSEEAHREYSHRFVVSGHWRLQPCGPKHADRRLTWVSAHIKGPADKPLITKSTVYEVRR